jgi:hypothetical protein
VTGQVKGWIAPPTSNNVVHAERAFTVGTAPTVSSTGLGTGSVAMDTGSTDLAGIITLTGSGTGGASGVITLTFNATTVGSNAPAIICTLMNGSGSWNARATAIIATATTTGATINWDNNAVSLNAANTWKVAYHIISK